ncbi:guanine deaminase, partial [Pseudomonas aeruginosa]|nr:guanine deaminase [Pseudomonas aeruginosa]
SDHGGSAMSSSAHRGRILHFLGDPAKLGDKAWEYFEDGLLWIEHGHVRALDHAAYLLPQLPADLPLEEHPQRLLLPGFVDCHV